MCASHISCGSIKTENETSWRKSYAQIRVFAYVLACECEYVASCYIQRQLTFKREM